MTTPLPAAIQGLVEALRELADALDRGDSYRVRAAALARCRAALAAWESRGRMRDDPKLWNQVMDVLQREAEQHPAMEILDIAEAALLGERGPAPSKGG